MSVHFGFAINALLCGLAFLGGRRWSRTTVNPYPRWRAGVSTQQRQIELIRINQAGRVIMIGAGVIWLILAAVYVLLILKFVSE